MSNAWQQATPLSNGRCSMSIGTQCLTVVSHCCEKNIDRGHLEMF